MKYASQKRNLAEIHNCCCDRLTLDSIWLQNCSGFSSSDLSSSSNLAQAGAGFCSQNPNDPSCANPTVTANCSFNGQALANHDSVTAYATSTVAVGATCQQQTRTCENGSLSGSYTYASCQVAAAASCLFNGQTIASGASVVAYQNSAVAAGGSCVQQNRTCSNGTLSGSYAYASCQVAAAASCLFNGQTIASGSSVTAYATSTVPAGGTCSPVIRTCYNGALTGSGSYASCQVAAAASCLFNGQTIPSGGTVTAFKSSTVPYGQTCQSETLTCTNGTLPGATSAFASCTVNAPASCLINGQTIASGSSITLYTTATAATASACVSQVRICTNGTLSGSATYASCTAQPSSGFTLPPVDQVAGVDPASFLVPSRSWMLGLNEVFALQSSPAMTQLPNLGVGINANITSRSLATLTSRLADLSASDSKHVGIYRDIIPVSMLAPSRLGDQTYYADLKASLMMFKGYNLRLILAFGDPLPTWMNPGESTWGPWCNIPNNPANWPTLKNNMAWAIGQFVATMANDPDLADWMKTHVYIEGFNEFDSLGTMSGGGCVLNASTPAQAADLQGGIMYVINHYGIQMQSLTPSIVGGSSAYLAGYYAAGGLGLPNVHIYPPTGQTTAQTVAFVKAKLAEFNAVLPAKLQNRIFLSETGMPESNTVCTPYSTSDPGGYLNGLFTDRQVIASTEATLAWRIYDLPQALPAPCEPYFGIVSSNGLSYINPAAQFFAAVQTLVTLGL